jgi:hypothetical protein
MNPESLKVDEIATGKVRSAMQALAEAELSDQIPAQ